MTSSGGASLPTSFEPTHSTSPLDWSKRRAPCNNHDIGDGAECGNDDPPAGRALRGVFERFTNPAWSSCGPCPGGSAGS